MPTVAIIGAGFSGLSVAIRLRQYAPVGLRVHLIDCARQLGSGLAYSNSDSLLRMNGMAGRLSAFEESPNHFLEWLAGNLGSDTSEDVRGEIGDHYALRRTYGSYLKAILREATSATSNPAAIDVVHDQVMKVIDENGRYSLELAHTGVLAADAVVLAHGYLQPRPICEEAWPECVESPWDIEAISNVPSFAKVLIVGTGQTMMDVVLMLVKQGHKGRILAISRRGLIAHPHAARESEYPLSLTDLPGNLNGIVRYIRTEARKHVAKEGDWRAVMNSLRPHTQRLWISLSEREKRRFLEHVAPYWRIHRTRVPPEIWREVQSLRSSGRLRCAAARIRSIERSKNSLCVTLSARGRKSSTTVYVDRVINCSGPNYDYGAAKSLLIRRLLDNGIIAKHPTGIGIHAAVNGAIIDRTGLIKPRMFTVGPPCKGTLFEITVIREIRRQARDVAIELIRSLCGEAKIAR